MHVANASRWPNPISVHDVKERVSVAIWMKCALHRVHFTVGACLLALAVSSAEQQRRAAISCKYISKYQWELSVAVVALHYARQPLESSSEPVRPSTLSLCVQLNAELHNAVRQTYGWAGRPADKRNRATQVRLIVAHTSRACCIPLQLCQTHTHRNSRRRTGTKAHVHGLSHDERATWPLTLDEHTRSYMCIVCSYCSSQMEICIVTCDEQTL